jgi:hypothetical protein
MNRRGKKLVRALALRDAALTIVKRKGTWTAGNIKVLIAYVGDIEILYRTPFQRLPAAGISHRRLAALSDRNKYYMAMFHQKFHKSNMPYGIDVWAPKKVLNIEWDDEGNIELVSFRAGDWEEKLTKAASENR